MNDDQIDQMIKDKGCLTCLIMRNLQYRQQNAVLYALQDFMNIKLDILKASIDLGSR